MTTSSTKLTVCVVTPCYNEQAVAALFHERVTQVFRDLPAYDYEILFVDDGSHDETLQILSRLHAADPHVGWISLSRNFGHQIALSAGLEHASADAVIVMDCDLQHPPELIPELIAKWQAGADIVSTIRQETKDSSWAKRLSSATFYRVINLLSDTPIVKNSADFALLSANALAAFRSMPERHRFLRGMISWMGFRREFVEFQAPPRAAGTSKYTWRKMIGLALTAIYSFSAKPLRLAIRIGVGIAALGMLYLCYVLWSALFRPEKVIEGWTSVIGVILVMSGVQLVFTGLIGEYVARLYEEAKARPLYFIKQSQRTKIAERQAP
jgi:dolichol-phosphate mannosyltransferase